MRYSRPHGGRHRSQNARCGKGSPRGNARGAIALLRRGAAAVADYEGEPPDGLDAAAVVTGARELAEQIDKTGVAALTEHDLRLRLATG